MTPRVTPLFWSSSERLRPNSGSSPLAPYLGGAWADPLIDLAVDYVRTFIGHGTNTYGAAHPFESVYTSERRLLMQDARDEVRAVYRSFNIDKQDEWREGEDHVALELEFMGILSCRTAAALRADDVDCAEQLLSAQRNFLDDHLRTWVPLMAADMRRFAKTDLYRGLADLVEGLLATDAEFLDGVLAE